MTQRRDRRVSAGGGLWEFRGNRVWVVNLLLGKIRPSNMNAKALSACFQRTANRCLPRPVGSRDLGRCSTKVCTIANGHAAEIVSLDTLAPQISARCAEISPVVKPFALSDNTMSSTPPRPRQCSRTIVGSKVPSRSRGTSISTEPTSVTLGSTWIA